MKKRRAYESEDARVLRSVLIRAGGRWPSDYAAGRIYGGAALRAGGEPPRVRLRLFAKPQGAPRLEQVRDNRAGAQIIHELLLRTLRRKGLWGVECTLAVVGTGGT
eukprot:7158385-Pyramimonas_sp.AAC.1